jgi:hypothetical protein
MRFSGVLKFSAHPFHRQGKYLDPEGGSAPVAASDNGEYDAVELVVGDGEELWVDGDGIGWHTGCIGEVEGEKTSLSSCSQSIVCT